MTCNSKCCTKLVQTNAGAFTVDKDTPNPGDLTITNAAGNSFVLPANCNIEATDLWTQLCAEEPVLFNALANGDGTVAGATTGPIPVACGSDLLIWSSDGSILVDLTAGSAIFDMKINPATIAQLRDGESFVDAASGANADVNALVDPVLAAPASGFTSGDLVKRVWNNGIQFSVYNGTGWDKCFTANDTFGSVKQWNAPIVLTTTNGTSVQPGQWYIEFPDGTTWATSDTSPNYANTDLASDANRTHSWDHNQVENFDGGSHERNYEISAIGGAGTHEIAENTSGRDVTAIPGNPNATRVDETLASGTGYDLDTASGSAETNLEQRDGSYTVRSRNTNTSDAPEANLEVSQAGALLCFEASDAPNTGIQTGVEARKAADGETELFVKTRDQASGAATAGQVLTLVDPATGEVEYQDSLSSIQTRIVCISEANQALPKSELYQHYTQEGDTQTIIGYTSGPDWDVNNQIDASTASSIEVGACPCSYDLDYSQSVPYKSLDRTETPGTNAGSVGTSFLIDQYSGAVTTESVILRGKCGTEIPATMTFSHVFGSGGGALTYDASAQNVIFHSTGGSDFIITIALDDPSASYPWGMWASSLGASEGLNFAQGTSVTSYDQGPGGINISLPFSAGWHNNNNNAYSAFGFDSANSITFRKNGVNGAGGNVIISLLEGPEAIGLEVCDLVEDLSASIPGKTRKIECYESSSVANPIIDNIGESDGTFAVVGAGVSLVPGPVGTVYDTLIVYVRNSGAAQSGTVLDIDSDGILLGVQTDPFDIPSGDSFVTITFPAITVDAAIFGDGELGFGGVGSVWGTDIQLGFSDAGNPELTDLQNSVNPLLGQVGNGGVVATRYDVVTCTDGNQIAYDQAGSEVPLSTATSGSPCSVDSGQASDYATADLVSDADRTHAWSHNQTEEFAAGTQQRRNYGNVNFSGTSVVEDDGGFTASSIGLSGDQESEIAVIPTRSQLAASDFDNGNTPEVKVQANADPVVGARMEYNQSPGGTVYFGANGSSGQSELYARDSVVVGGTGTDGMVFTLVDPATGLGRWEEKQVSDFVETRQKLVTITVPGGYTLIRAYDFDVTNSDGSVESFTVNAGANATDAEQATEWATRFNNRAGINGTWAANGNLVEGTLGLGEACPESVIANIDATLSFNSGSSPTNLQPELEWEQGNGDLTLNLLLGDFNVNTAVTGQNGITPGSGVAGSPDTLTLTSTNPGWVAPDRFRVRVDDLDPGAGEFVEFSVVPDLVEPVNAGSAFTVTGSRVDPTANNTDIFATFSNISSLTMQQRTFAGGSNRIGYVQAVVGWDYESTVSESFTPTTKLIRCGDDFTDINGDPVTAPDEFVSCGTYDAIDPIRELAEEGNQQASEIDVYVDDNFIQRGTIVMSNSIESITFPQPFADDQYQLLLTVMDNQAFFATETDIPANRLATGTQFSAYNENGVNQQTTVHWLAIGTRA